MTNTPDIDDLKRQMSRTEFIYIFAFGSTGKIELVLECSPQFGWLNGSKSATNFLRVGSRSDCVRCVTMELSPHSVWQDSI